MTTSIRTFLSALAVLPIALFISPRPAIADIYNVYTLGTDNSGRLSPYGITDSGHVVVMNADCGYSPTGLCYFESTFNGVNIGESYTPPDLPYDNGTPCTVPASLGLGSYTGVCNNGRIAFQGGTGDYYYLYSGPISNPTIVYSGTAAFLRLDANGDFVWEDQRSETMYLAVETTPEPSTLLQVDTGIAAFAEFLRRRRMP